MQIEEGTIVTGKITGITDFGAFVEMEGGKTGMIHISEVASGYVKDIKDHLQVGQEVKAKVLSISEQGKISLSIKRLESNSGDKPAGKPAGKPQYQKRDDNRTRNSNPHVWQGTKKPATNEKQSFEDMMASFKKSSEEKMSDLKRTDAKRGSMGYSRRGKN